jgi:uncharacterized protein YajQ (UPF0234 family)
MKDRLMRLEEKVIALRNETSIVSGNIMNRERDIERLNNKQRHDKIILAVLDDQLQKVEAAWKAERARSGGKEKDDGKV